MPRNFFEQLASHQFQLKPLSWSRFTFPPLSTQTTFEPFGALINPFNSAATGDAAAPSTTSLQWCIVHIIASNIVASGNDTTSSTKLRTTSKVYSPTLFTLSPSIPPSQRS